MNLKRLALLYHKIRFTLIVDGCKRAEYLRKHQLLKEIGENCMYQSRNFPMDPKMVKIHDNVTIAADVTFCTHDAIRHMLYFRDYGQYVPHLGCIEVEQNVFIGIGSIIMPNVHIGKDSIIAAGSLVLRDVHPGTVVGGVPAKVIGDFERLHAARILEGQELHGLTQTQLEELIWARFNIKTAQSQSNIISGE